MNKLAFLLVTVFFLMVACDPSTGVVQSDQHIESEFADDTQYKRWGNQGGGDSGTNNAYECIENGNIQSSSSNASNTADLAIDCDPATGWISGSTGSGSLNVFFDSLTTLSGVRITTQSGSVESQSITITALKIDRTSVSITETINVSTSSSSVDLDFGLGFGEYVGLTITLPDQTIEWKSINEIELIVGSVEEEEEFENPQTFRECRRGGWRDFGFRNQRQCYKYVKAVIFCSNRYWKKNHNRCDPTKFDRRRR